MARGFEQEDEESSGSEQQFSVIESIHRLAYHNARAELNSEEQLLMYLQSWWSRTYNRPLKDPLLKTYTLEELIYEFYDRIERQKAQQEQLEQEGDKIDQAKEKAALDWAEEEERKELAAEAAKKLQKDGASSSAIDPSKDPSNIAWMEQQMAEAKQHFGEDFGEDIDDNFED